MPLTRGFILGAVTTPNDARLMDLGRVVSNADGTARTGVLTSTPTGLVSALGTMNVSIAAGVFATSRSRQDGVAIFANDGTASVAISAAPVSNSRITSIWVKHNDSTQGDADNLPVFGTTDGAAAASPVAPAIPTGALELAQLRVYAGTTAANGGSNTLTETYRMTAAQGGVVPVRDATELSAYTAPNGALAMIVSTGVMFRRTGGAWKVAGGSSFAAVQVQAPGSGTVTATGSMGALPGTAALSTNVTVPVACRAKITLMFKFAANAVGCGVAVGVGLTGATILTPTATDVSNVQVLQQAINQTNTYDGGWIVNLNAGTTTFTVLAQAIGVGGTRSIATVSLVIEPVSE